MDSFQEVQSVLESHSSLISCGSESVKVWQKQALFDISLHTSLTQLFLYLSAASGARELCSPSAIIAKDARKHPIQRGN